MSLKKFNPRMLVLLAFMLLAAVVRIVLTIGSSKCRPMATFTPLGAMALFGGAYFSKSYKAYLFPVLTFWMSDIILNRLVYYGEWRFFYEGFYWTYGSFALIAFAGQRDHPESNMLTNVVLASLVAVL